MLFELSWSAAGRRPPARYGAGKILEHSHRLRFNHYRCACPCSRLSMLQLQCMRGDSNCALSSPTLDAAGHLNTCKGWRSMVDS